FIDDVFFGIGYDQRANIVGFNLPFDISRLAIEYAAARDWSRNKEGGSGAQKKRLISMRGGFSFKLSRSPWRPRVVVKHHSRTLAFIRFAAPPEPSIARSERKRKRQFIRRGYFTDLRTIGAALTSELHSLESLADFLEVEHPKDRTEEHGKALT